MQFDLNNFLTASGEVNEGQLLRYWRREIIKWESTQTIVNLFNEAVGVDKQITRRWWQRMEQNNKVPVDRKRRLIIRTLVNIPPAYIGLTSAGPSLSSLPAPPMALPARVGLIDVHEYNANLKTWWSSPYIRNENLPGYIFQLQEALLYGAQQPKEQIARLLCEYLIIAGNIERACGLYDAALPYLDRAVNLARERDFSDLEAKAFYMRSYVFFERWRIRPDRQHNRADILQSITDGGQAVNTLKGKVPVTEPSGTSLLAAIHNLYGETVAMGDKNIKLALHHLNKADDFLPTLSRDPFFFDINRDWCQIGKAQAFISLNWPKTALSELAGLRNKNPQKQRRYITSQIAEAEAYIDSGKTDIGLAYATDALQIASKIGAHGHITRLSGFYEILRQNDKHSRNPDVVRLGLQILKVQHPMLFQG